MKKQYGCIIILILGLLTFPQLAEAQSNRNPCIYLTTANTNCVAVGSSINGVGNSPMPVGGLATSAAPTYVQGMMGGLSFDLSGNLRTTSSGGGGGGAVTIADGADVAEGATTDSPASTPTTASAATIISLLKSLANSNVSSVPAGSNNIGTFTIPSGASTSALQTTGNTALTTINTTLGTPFQAGGSIGNTTFAVTQGTSPWVVSGTFTPSGSTAITAASGAIASGAMVDLGSQADAVCGTATGTCSMIALAKYLNNAATSSIPAGTAIIGKVGIDQTTPGTTNLVSLSAETTKVIGTVNQGTSPWVVSGTVTANGAVTNAGTFATQAQPTPVTSGGLTVYNVQPTASDNHVVIKAGAGQVYKLEAFNNSATVNYVRLYNATTGFNGCNSATNLVWQAVIPASTSGAGLASSWDMGMAFATGISICVTSGYAQTDTTNATASALIVNIGYK